MVILTESEKDLAKEKLAQSMPRLRKELGLSQEAFGTLCGISRVRLSLIERGEFKMLWSHFTSFMLIFLLNRRTKKIIITEQLFTTRLMQFLQCKNEDEEPDQYLRIDLNNNDLQFNTMYSGLEAELNQYKEFKLADGEIVDLDMLNDNMMQSYKFYIRRCSRFAHILARTMLEMNIRKSDSFSEKTLPDIEEAVKYFNIGWALVPANLWHNSMLTEADKEVIMHHPQDGLNLIMSAMSRTSEIEDRGSDYISALNMAMDASISHHERWDGQGYPYKLRGEQIPLIGRICAVINEYDGVTRGRYDTPLPHEYACIRIMRASGTEFDPKIIEAFNHCHELIKSEMQDFIRREEQEKNR